MFAECRKDVDGKSRQRRLSVKSRRAAAPARGAVAECAARFAMCGYSAHGLAMTKEVLWSNLDEAIRARRDGRPPVYED